MATALGKQKQDDLRELREQQIRWGTPQAVRQLPTTAVETTITIHKFRIRLQAASLKETISPLPTILSLAG